MEERFTDISNQVLEMEVLAERIRVLSNDLDQEYFGRCIGKEEMWKIAGHYYEHAGIKMDMILSMTCDICNMLGALQESL